MRRATPPAPGPSLKIPGSAPRLEQPAPAGELAYADRADPFLLTGHRHGPSTPDRRRAPAPKHRPPSPPTIRRADTRAGAQRSSRAGRAAGFAAFPGGGAAVLPPLRRDPALPASGARRARLGRPLRPPAHLAVLSHPSPPPVHGLRQGRRAQPPLEPSQPEPAFRTFRPHRAPGLQSPDTFSQHRAGRLCPFCLRGRSREKLA